MLKVDAAEVAHILAKIADEGLSAERTHDGACLWTIRASGYVIEIFDDAGEVDYVERATDPKGRVATFNNFMNALGFDPIDLLNQEQKDKLAALMYGDRLDALMGRERKSKRRRQY